jgi:hypothetical protein
MTLNSYRDPELRDRRSVFARHPLATVLGAIVGAFLLLVPIGQQFRQADHVVVRTAQLPGGVVDAGVLIDDTTSSSPPTIAATTVAAAPDTTAAPSTAPTTAESIATTRKPVTTPRPATTAKKRAVATTAPKPAATAAKPKATTTAKAAPTTVKATTTTATTAKPTTTVAPPVAYSAAQSEAVIRRVWPDDLEVQALAIATRESNLRNTAHNSCCYGLFQIKFTVHEQWLSTLGVTRPEQLYDPTVNATVAYGLYLQCGWAPWGG